jgi:uncharacterized membrane protein YagU involved in acid resistance
MSFSLSFKDSACKFFSAEKQISNWKLMIFLCFSVVFSFIGPIFAKKAGDIGRQSEQTAGKEGKK